MELNVSVPHHLNAVTLLEGTYYTLAIKMRSCGVQGSIVFADFDLRNPKNYIENQNLQKSYRLLWIMDYEEPKIVLQN